MNRSLFPAAITILAIATGCLAAPGDSAPEPPRLSDPAAGWSVAVPEGWQTGGRVVATAFAEGARCRSTSVVDRVDPGGPGPSVSRSFVQVCARPARDGRTLTSFMTATYGPGFAVQFAPAAMGDRLAFRSRRSDPALVFLQTGSHRLQLASSATKEESRRRQRRAQVDRVLRSLRVRTAS